MESMDPQLQSLVCELFESAGISSHPCSITSIKRGGNNQISLVTCEDQKVILKQYFQNPQDSRNRLHTEFEFLKIASERAPGLVPKVYSKSDEKYAALYEFILGNTIEADAEITENFVHQAARFIAKLNSCTELVAPAYLSPASEACFSIEQHIQTIDERLNELEQSKSTQPWDDDFTHTLSQICRCWLEIKTTLLRRCHQDRRLPLASALSPAQQILSPSDFGFQNVLIQPNAQLAFIDFEYAGWDDPAKLVGDFFAQVAMPVDIKYFDLFLTTAFKNRADYEEIHARSLALLSLYKIKWCCIVLNIYLPKHLARRQFADPQLDVPEIKRKQLLKAKQLLEETTL
jgi:hypothetical protein